MKFRSDLRMTMGDAAGDAYEAAQVKDCAAAAGALARGNPAFQGLMNMCGTDRGINIAAGRLVVDDMTVDPLMRVQLTDTGTRIINGDARLGTIFHALTPDRARGFAIGVKCAAAIGGPAASYGAKVRATLNAESQAGYDLGFAKVSSLRSEASAPTQKQSGGPAASSEGIPQSVLIGGGAVVVLGLGALAYFLTR